MQRFEWDIEKQRINEQKHGLSFEEAKSTFYDPYLLLIEDRVVNGEIRHHAIGFANHQLLLTVAHTVRYEDGEQTIIRIISARKADKYERKRYGAALVRSR